jgi:chorismate mutase
VGEFKRSERQVTRDYQREKRVLDGARDNAVDLGIEPDIAEQIMRLLI